MKYFVLSDIHTDVNFEKFIDRKRIECKDPDESVSRETLEGIWKCWNYPTDVDGIIVPGDITNDYLSTTYTLKWLSEKYRRVYFCIGNHDMTVRGGTPSESNLQFLNSYEKVEALDKYANSLGNCKLLDGSKYGSIAGTMGFADFKCWSRDEYSAVRAKLYWKRSWYDGKHWRLVDMDPDSLWEKERKIMLDLIKSSPRVFVTHFAPIQVGILFDFRLDPINSLFYFDGKEFLEAFESDAYWLCGHTHDARKAVYVNSKGANVTILCNPSGYPTDPHRWTYGPKMQEDWRAFQLNERTNEEFVIEI